MEGSPVKPRTEHAGMPMREKSTQQKNFFGYGYISQVNIFVIDEYETDTCTYIFLYFRFVDIVTSHSLDVGRNNLVS